MSRFHPPAGAARSQPTPKQVILAGIALMLAVMAAFSPLLDNGFVDFDDDQYITANPVVLKGLTWQGIGWAFTEVHANNWHPLTWISHMADVSLFGLDPRGHHLVSLTIHAASSALLLATLAVLTQALWPSVFAAALFALHPLRVESVAWAAERKDVLAAFLWICVLAAYAWYVRKPVARRYVVVVATFALGLLAKPLLVSLPVALLLLDLWPLRRGPWARLLAEKMPLFALAAASGVATYLIQERTGAVSGGDILSFPTRAANAALSTVAYLLKMAWPEGLSVLYLHPERTLPASLALACFGLVAVTTLFVAWQYRARPYLLVGWLWYLVTLAPMIGLVQVGLQGMADRYTYIPSIGVAVAVTWGARDLLGALKAGPTAPALLAVALLLPLGAATHLQAGRWRDTLTLFGWAATVAPDNWYAHNKAGEELERRGDGAGAARHFAESVRLKPVFYRAHFNLGNALFKEGKLAEAGEHYAQATLREPSFAPAWNQLGLVRYEQGRMAESEAAFAEAARLQPGLFEARFNRGLALERLGRYPEAAASYQEALRITPSSVDAARRLRLLRLRVGAGSP